MNRRDSAPPILHLTRGALCACGMILVFWVAPGLGAQLVRPIVQFSFQEGLLEGWEAETIPPQDRLPDHPPAIRPLRDAEGNVRNIRSPLAWQAGHFPVTRDGVLHLRFLQRQPGFFMLFLQVKPPGEEGNPVNYTFSFEGHRPAGQMIHIEIPLAQFIRIGGGDPPPAGHVVSMLMFDLQKRETGFELYDITWFPAPPVLARLPEHGL